MLKSKEMGKEKERNVCSTLDQAEGLGAPDIQALKERPREGKQCQSDFPRETMLSLVLYPTVVPQRTGEGAKTCIPPGERQSCISVSCARVRIPTQGANSKTLWEGGKQI